ncbi:hypothetical protein [Pelagovum pacificum]|uniref:Uncharacterized protein n=1 Tax=Pelagovum pacificum TaxID=2588711 RepID=A0A5C5GB79_9RHOB|nr:hypothetical protein [Pelagovum pacificum]QQA41178.1 hypothetical protein I8N54_10065 [Pelagovum pacificum]TNY32013.1 hypothetical protein FHY64_01535 [Pelagovum pacificum]
MNGRHLHRRLTGQTRRLTTVAVCAILATSLLVDAALAPLLAGLAAILFGSALLLLFPGRRQLLEVAGLGAVLTALMPVEPALLPGLFLFWGAVAHVLLYGKWSDLPFLRLKLETRAHSQVSEPMPLVWRWLVPGAGHPDDHWSGALMDFDSDDDDHETLYLRFRTPDGLFEEATLTFIEQDRPHHCRYMLERTTRFGLEETEVTHHLTEVNGKTDVETRTVQADLPPRIAIARWFDDVRGERPDDGASVLEDRSSWSATGLGRIRARSGSQLGAEDAGEATVVG